MTDLQPRPKRNRIASTPRRAARALNTTTVPGVPHVQRDQSKNIDAAFTSLYLRVLLDDLADGALTTDGKFNSPRNP